MTSDAPPPSEARAAHATKITIVSYYFSMDRILLTSSLVPALERDCDLEIVSFAPAEASFVASHPYARYLTVFDRENKPPRGYSLPYQFNHYLWDHALKASTTRADLWDMRARHRVPRKIRLLSAGAEVGARLGLHRPFERWLAAAATRFSRNAPATRAFEARRPDVVVAMCPFGSPQTGYVAAAKKLAIPVLAFITSFDNLSTKGRMVFDYDGYVVWSEAMKEELLQFVPAARRRPVYVTGAPQYDVFFQDAFRQSREAFFAENALDAAKPLIVYGLGSPNFFDEVHGAIRLVERLETTPDLRDVQVIVRLHPGFSPGQATWIEKLEAFPRVCVQRPAWKEIPYQDDDAIRQWVNTMRHADVLINLSSTLSVDAAIFDTPVINLDFDPSPSGADQELVRRINHRSNHFRPVAESGGLWLVDDVDGMLDAIRTYLEHPALHREGRRRVVELVAGPADGAAGARMAEAITAFVRSRT